MFLDTANIEEIKECLKTGVFRGVTTNPTILLKEKKNRYNQIADILATDTSMLYVQIVGVTVEELFSDYKNLKDTFKQRLGFKVSINFTGLEVVKKIKLDDKDNKVLGTAIYSPDQAIFGALAGCDCVAPYVNRMLNNNIDPFDSIKKMRDFFNDRNLDCEIIAASFKNIDQILRALQSGANTCTIPADLFKLMVNKELAQNAIDVFNNDNIKLSEYSNK